MIDVNQERIIHIIGSVVFPPAKMPNVYNALIVKGQYIAGQPINVSCEVQQLLGNNWITTR